MSFRTFDDVISYMDNETRPQGRNVRDYRLDRMRQIMQKLDNPQNSFKSIHIAGSKGKGSTSSYLASAISASGYKTGLYLSPHVSDYRERFTIDGKFASEEDLVYTGNILAEKLSDFSFSEYPDETSPTTFELYTAFAFLLFKHAGCEWAVVETGMGGRLDATNVLFPEASVITPIELEHTEILGDTIEKIAVEKSKIIKPGTPSFISIQKPEAQRVFEKEAAVQHSKITELEDELIELSTVCTKDGQSVDLKLKDGYKVHLNLKMTGNVQAYNCALAVLVLRHLNLYKAGISERALENNILPGRMELINWKRPLYIDGAHTENSIGQLVKSFKELYPDDDSICIFGCLSDKNAEAMGQIILKNFKTTVICKPGDYKKNNPEELFRLFIRLKSDQQRVYLIEDAAEALNFCVETTKTDTPVLVCGSFYLAGSIKEALCH